jgi:DNA-binding transcriptional regulator YhcF (GntR family)
MKRKAEPKYFAVKNRIIRMIESGRVLPGQSPGGEHELARAEGVSKFSVIKAFTELVSEGVLVRYQGKGTFVTEAAPALVGHLKKRTKTLRLGSLQPDLDVSAALERYKLRHPGTEIELVPQKTEADVKFLGGSLNQDQVVELLPLDRYIRAVPNWEAQRATPPIVLRRYTFGGQLYGVPYDHSAMVLYYNADMFAEAGVELPNDQWTWADLLHATRRLTSVDKKRFGFLSVRSLLSLMPFILSNGGKLMAADGEQCVFASREVVEAIEFYRELEQASPIRMGEIETKQRTFDAFMDGQVAMMVWGGPLASLLQRRNVPFKWSVAPIPLAPSGKRGTIVFSTAFGISKQCTDAGRAWDLVCALTDPQAMADAVEKGRLLPADTRVPATGVIADVLRAAGAIPDPPPNWTPKTSGISSTTICTRSGMK